MLDFRYHALTIVAVLVALLVGLLLGVAIGDQNLVSSAEKDVRNSLRQDVRDRQRQVADLKDQIATRDQFEAQVYPLLVGGQLQGSRVALIFLGDSDADMTARVREALAGTGADLSLVAVVREPLDVPGLSERATGTRFSDMENDPSLIEPFGRRMGSQLIAGGRLIVRERPVLFRSASGTLAPVQGVVLVRDHPQLDSDQQQQVDDFEAGFLRGMQLRDGHVVGVETTGTDPSSVQWFREHGASSVDNVDGVDGHAALVFALAGANGAFGTGPDAQALLPPVVGGVNGP